MFEDDDVTDEIYRSNEASRYTNAAAAAAVRAHLEPRTATAVWEIGGGTGATTEPVLDAVRDLDLRYHFTDVGRWFLDQALDRWAGRAGLTTGLADINDPDLASNLALPPAGGYDVALAANVLHNAADPARTLTAVARAVAEDGLLVMIETAREHLPLLVSMRFLMSPPGPGARFTDHRAATGRIFLSLPEWKDALARSGWRLDLTAPGPDPSHPAARYDQHLLVARRVAPEIGTA
nr:class I SAM-dependent methyltransferase [Glycomyces sp. L485]